MIVLVNFQFIEIGNDMKNEINRQRIFQTFEFDLITRQSEFRLFLHI